jgi:hypothetical protein
MRDKPSVIIDEAHRNLKPYVIAQKAIDRLLSGIPKKYLSGLKSVVLSDSGALNHQRKRQKTLWRKHKVAIRKSFGLYHQRWQGQPAWIEIFVDNIIRDWPSWLLMVPFFRDLFFGEVLFHEIGHHIHYTQAPEHREREDVAEKWGKQLGHYFFKRKYWYITFPMLFIRMLLKPISHFLSRRSSLHSRE